MSVDSLTEALRKELYDISFADLENATKRLNFWFVV